MKRIEKLKIKLTSRQILMYLADGIMTIEDIFNPHIRYGKNTNQYWREREVDKIQFSKDIYRLKRQKFIRTYFENKNQYVVATKKGKQRIKQYQIEKIVIPKPEKWDKKWRIVIFDIPESQKIARNALNRLLKKIGFFHLQKSVFVYPFESYKEVKQIGEYYDIGKNIQYIIADRIETESNLIKEFYDREILRTKM